MLRDPYFHDHDDGYLDEDFDGPAVDNGMPKETEKRFMNGKHILTNLEITAPLLRIIGPAKEQMGMKPRDDALKLAVQMKMDLILINPEQAPPIARIIQWSKYKFEFEQADKVKKSKVVVVETKEVKLTPKTDDNDVAIKMKAMLKFLGKSSQIPTSLSFILVLKQHSHSLLSCLILSPELFPTHPHPQKREIRSRSR